MKELITTVGLVFFTDFRFSMMNSLFSISTRLSSFLFRLVFVVLRCRRAVLDQAGREKRRWGLQSERTSYWIVRE